MPYAARPPEERFWPKVDKHGANGCWIWTAGRTDSGYGVFMLEKGTLLRAHRFAYELLVGPIPEGLTLDHLCRVRACVNPDHLEPVTKGENTRRGTSLIGENARKTHCKNGHPLSGENLIVRKSGARQCRICVNARWRRQYHEARQAA